MDQVEAQMNAIASFEGRRGVIKVHGQMDRDHRLEYTIQYLIASKLISCGFLYNT